MGKAPPLQQDISDAYIKPVSLQCFSGFGTLTCRKRGIQRNFRGRLFRSVGGGAHGHTRKGLLPSVSEWMTSTNCASPGSNLSSGGLPLYKGPAGSRPGKKTKSGWQLHTMSHKRPGF